MFDISMLKSSQVSVLSIDEDFSFSRDDVKDTDIVRLENIHVSGKIERIEESTYKLDLNIKGNMVLLCARSLEEVDYPLNIFVNENISSSDSEELPLITQNMLDLRSIVWENIVLEVPLRVIKEDASFISQGEGWNLVDEYVSQENSPFSELSNLLDMEGKE